MSMTVQLLDRKTKATRDIAVDPSLPAKEMIAYAEKFRGPHEETNGIYQWT